MCIFTFTIFGQKRCDELIPYEKSNECHSGFGKVAMATCLLS